MWAQQLSHTPTPKFPSGPHWSTRALPGVGDLPPFLTPLIAPSLNSASDAELGQSNLTLLGSLERRLKGEERCLLLSQQLMAELSAAATTNNHNKRECTLVPTPHPVLQETLRGQRWVCLCPLSSPHL